MPELRTIIAASIAHLITAFLIFVLPFAGRYRYKQLKQQLANGDTKAKLRFYRRALAQQIVLALLVLTWRWLARVPAAKIGLVAPDSWKLSVLVLCCITAAILVSIVRFRKTGDDKLRRALEMAGGIVPTSPVERRLFAAFGLGAGIVEEFVCRGFLIYYLFASLSLVNPTLLVIVSSAIFGFAHLYQGRKGILLTGILGLCFAALYLSTGSLLVPVVIHVLIDLRIIWIFTPARLQSLNVAVATADIQGA